jgi:predicted acylesterase/phospholipase RssA
MTYSLVLSGGSIKGFGLLGAIESIFEKYKINEFTSFFGTSIGGIICYLLCIGYKPLEIIHNINYNRILHKVKIDIGELDVKNIFTKKGLFNFESIVEEIELMTLIKHNSLFTFKSLYENLGKELCCITYNYTLRKKEILHYTTTPNLPCLIGLQMSSAIPFIFDKFEYESNLYIDGGIVDNFPVEIAINNFNKKNIIGLCISPTISNDDNKELYNSYTNIPKFISNLLYVPIVEITKNSIEKYKNHENTIKIYNIPINYHFLNFNVDISMIMEMFSTGYNICSTMSL